MRTCEEYMEIISAVTDGEGSPAEEAELFAHIENCALCRSVFDAFGGISAILSEEEEPAPNLTADIMSKIQDRASRRKKHSGYIIRFISVAACLTVIIYGAAQLRLFNGLPRTGAGSGNSPAYNAALPQPGGESAADTDMPAGAAEHVTGGAALPERAPAPEAAPEIGESAAGGSNTVLPEHEPASPPEEAASAEDTGTIHDRYPEDSDLPAGGALSATDGDVSAIVRGFGAGELSIAGFDAVSRLRAILSVLESPYPDPPGYEPDCTIVISGANGDIREIALWFFDEKIICSGGGSTYLAAGTEAEFLRFIAEH